MMTEEQKTYLLDHGTKHMLPEERRALAKLAYLEIGLDPRIYKQAAQNIERMYAQPDDTIDHLVALGKEKLRQIIAERLFKEHADEILNPCPRCEKLARTPLAKQCRYCGFDWH
jgi:hypothetical protein